MDLIRLEIQIMILLIKMNKSKSIQNENIVNKFQFDRRRPSDQL